MIHDQQKFAHHINDKNDRQRAKQLRHLATPAEQMLWKDLRSLPEELALKFRRQHPIHPYVADFACVSCKLIIELDGFSHDLSAEADQNRTAYLQKLGYTVLRFTNDEVYKMRMSVVETIVQRAVVELLWARTPTPPQGEGNK